MKRKYGHASVEEHPKGSGRFRVRASVGGKLITIATKLDRKTAEATADAHAANRHAADLREGITLTHFGETFLDRRERLHGLRSVKEDRNRWKYVTEDVIGKIPISSVRPSDVIDWRDRLLGRKTRRGKPMAAQTVKNALNLLRVALNEAVERELCQQNAAKDVRVPRGRSATTKLELEGILLPHEQTALLAAVPSHHRPMVLFALSTGLRWSEISWLRWEDVLPDAVNVRRSRRGGPTKKGRARRLPLLGPATLAIQEAAALRQGMSPWVFPGPRTGEPRTYVPSRWKVWLRAAGIAKHVRFHDLRHTTATSLLAGWWGRKWSLEEVRQALGHSSVQVTERYAELLDETLENAVRGTSGPSFPSGNTDRVSARTEVMGNAFLNRWPDVRIVSGAPNDSEALALPPALGSGKSGDRPDAWTGKPDARSTDSAIPAESEGVTGAEAVSDDGAPTRDSATPTFPQAIAAVAAALPVDETDEALVGRLVARAMGEARPLRTRAEASLSPQLWALLMAGERMGVVS